MVRYELPEGYEYGVTHTRCYCHRCGGSDNTSNTEMFHGSKLIGHFVFCNACRNIRHPEYVVNRWEKWKRTTLTDVVPSRLTKTSVAKNYKVNGTRKLMFKPSNIKDTNTNRWGIAPEILKLYDVSLKDGEWRFPLFRPTGEHVGYHTRRYDPLDDTKYEANYTNGVPINEVLFGQPTARYIDRGTLVFCEGMTDTLAARQMAGTRAGTYTFVGAASATVLAQVIANAWEWASKFKSVLYCVDNDEAGRRAAAAVKALNLPKLKQLILPPTTKDIRQLLNEGREGVFIDSLYAAGANALDCLMSPTEMAEAVRKKRGTAYPTGVSSLDELLKGGLYPHELSVWLAGSGSGKSTFGRYLLSRQDNGAYLPFEESADLAISKYYAHTIVATPNGLDEDMVALAQRTAVVRTDRIQLDNNTVDEWLQWFGAFIVSSGRNFFLVDHITNVAQTLRGDSERERIQQLMAGMAELVKRYPIHIAVLSQINRPSVEYDENGEVVDHPVTLTSGFGASAIEHYAFVVCGIDGRDDRTRIRLLKDRNGGQADRDGKVYTTVTYSSGLYSGGKIALGKDNAQEIQQHEDNIQGAEVRQPNGTGAVQAARSATDTSEPTDETVPLHGGEGMDAYTGLPDPSVLHRNEGDDNGHLRATHRETYSGIRGRIPQPVSACVCKPKGESGQKESQRWLLGDSAWSGVDNSGGTITRPLANQGRTGATTPTPHGSDNDQGKNVNRRTLAPKSTKARHGDNNGGSATGTVRPEENKDAEKQKRFPFRRAHVATVPPQQDGGGVEERTVHPKRDRWGRKLQ